MWVRVARSLFSYVVLAVWETIFFQTLAKMECGQTITRQDEKELAMLCRSLFALLFLFSFDHCIVYPWTHGF
jgi:hypothetical protein